MTLDIWLAKPVCGNFTNSQNILTVSSVPCLGSVDDLPDTVSWLPHDGQCTQFKSIIKVEQNTINLGSLSTTFWEVVS